MKGKKLVLAGIGFLMCTAVLPATAQRENKVEIKGIVIEKSNGEAVESAAVRLLSGKDSTMQAGVATDARGLFSIKDVSPGTYILNVTFLGLEDVYHALQVTGRNATVDLGKIEMTENSILLNEAVVKGKITEVIVKADTVEYNADAFRVTDGAMLEELLKQLPGAEVAADGTVTVNGKQIKKILVDGKEFFSDDPKVASKNLPAKMVEKVQAYDRRSDMAMMTGFDDGEEEAVINLQIRAGMKEGVFGNAFAGYGSKDRYEANMMVNRFVNNDQYSLLGGINNTNNMGFTDLASTMFSGMGGGGRRGMVFFGGANGITTSGNMGLNFSKEFSPKLTLGGNIRYSHSDNDAQTKEETENILKSGNTFDYETAANRAINNNVGANLRLTWKPDTLTQVIFTPDFSLSGTNRSENSDSYTLNSTRDSINTVTSDAFSKGHGYNLNGRLEASRRLNDWGRVLSVSLSAGTGNTINDSHNYSLTRFLLDPNMKDELIDQQIDYDNTNFNYRAFVSWVEPVGRNNFIQLSYRYNGSEREALKNAFSLDGAGNYNVLDSTYSKSSRNEAANQRASIAFKAQREKYNYTIGFNVDPSYSKLETFVGDNILDSRSRHVVNYSPTVQFNYRPNRDFNVRVEYEGETSQPTMQQLQPVLDVSNPLNTTEGNPDLKPIYTNDLQIRIQNYNPEKQSMFMLMANGNYIVNAVVNSTTNDPNTGKRHTTYLNSNGNYGGNLRFMFNTPIFGKAISINNMAFASFQNESSFSNGEKNTNKRTQLQDHLGINYRSGLLDLGVNGNISYQRTRNSLDGQQDLNTYNYGGGATATVYLPLSFRIESDITYSTNQGYSSGFEQKEWLWNASVSKDFLKGNAGTLRFKIYDILQQRSNISYSSSANYNRYSEYNTLTSYFMFHFIYRFSIFKGGATMGDMRRGGPPGQRGPGGGEGGGRRIIRMDGPM
ncbi:MAG: outer membrane beta-barrel protein [Tannerella sp.]|jgi:hypothetical protein|nr:outer membrane beta-barrel protein [Tannerella sp.]